jgi:GxxExxY protein
MVLRFSQKSDYLIQYDGVSLDIDYRIDLLVENVLIVELKSVAQLAPTHKAQILTYLKLCKLSLGLLLNFNTVHLKDGIVRVINSIPSLRVPLCPLR